MIFLTPQGAESLGSKSSNASCSKEPVDKGVFHGVQNRESLSVMSQFVDSKPSPRTKVTTSSSRRASERWFQKHIEIGFLVKLQELKFTFTPKWLQASIPTATALAWARAMVKSLNWQPKEKGLESRLQKKINIKYLFLLGLDSMNVATQQMDASKSSWPGCSPVFEARPSTDLLRQALAKASAN